MLYNKLNYVHNTANQLIGTLFILSLFRLKKQPIYKKSEFCFAGSLFSLSKLGV